MNTLVTEICNKALALSANDRLALVTFLWDSLAQQGENLSNEKETLALARKRAEELDSGAVTALTHEEVMRSLQKVSDETRLSSKG